MEGKPGSRPPLATFMAPKDEHEKPGLQSSGEGSKVTLTPQGMFRVPSRRGADWGPGLPQQPSHQLLSRARLSVTP